MLNKDKVLEILDTYIYLNQSLCPPGTQGILWSVGGKRKAAEMVMREVEHEMMMKKKDSV